MELKERSLRVERLAAKFATLTLKNKPAGEEEEPRSQAYYVIKVGQPGAGAPADEAASLHSRGCV
jgi:hypothetical protein